MTKLRVNEIFFSLQGETRTVGIPTVFVRLTGCPLRCQYCDTEYAFTEGAYRLLPEILAEVQQYSAQYVTVTGGEPLAQPACLSLLQSLCDLQYTVSLETSGALDISTVDCRVCKVVDVKTPGSGEESANRYENFEYLMPHDQVKFVICDRADYEWSKSILEQHQLAKQCEILFSPSHGQLDNASLAQWMLADRIPARFQLQIHKYIWGDVRGK